MKTILFLLLALVFAPLTAQLVPFKFSEQNQKWGFKDKNTDNIVIYWHFATADSFNKYGLAKVKYKNKEGCIDTLGKVVVPFYYNSLINCKKDTVTVSLNKTLIRKDSDYYEFKDGILNTDFPIRKWPNKDLKITTFNYPRDKALVQNLIVQERQSEIGNVPNNLNNELSFTTIVGHKENITSTSAEFWPANSMQVKFTRLLNASIIGNRNGCLGITTGYMINKYWVDTAVIRTNQLFIGLSHRIYLGKHAYVKIGAYPIINQITQSHKRGETQWNLNSLATTVSSTFESSFNFILGNNMLCGLGYKYIPSPFLRNKIQRNYLSLSVGFQI